jgi:ribosomal protein S18 acetylase RimI-like enzyme
MSTGGSSRAQVMVRPAALSDLDVLVRFSAAMAMETEGRMLDLARLRQGTRAVLESADRGYYLVAEAMSGVVGQLLITYEWSDWRNGVFWWIQSVYVDPSARGQGVYRAMHTQVLQDARRQGNVCGLRLYVEKQNAAALEVYRRLGLGVTTYRIYEQDFVLGSPETAEIA